MDKTDARTPLKHMAQTITLSASIQMERIVVERVRLEFNFDEYTKKPHTQDKVTCAAHVASYRRSRYKRQGRTAFL